LGWVTCEDFCQGDLGVRYRNGEEGLGLVER
jgi:hypothetical protein